MARIFSPFFLHYGINLSARLIALVFFFFGLVACGGGSNSTAVTSISSMSSAQNSSVANQSPAARSLVFAHSDLLVVVGRDSSNVASAPGSAAIVYESSNPDIATVDATGLVTGVSPGSVVISASIPAEEVYQAATASYDLEVLPETLEVTAWLGEDDISVTFPENVRGFELFHSSNTSCTWINFANCAEGELSILDLLEINDSRTTLTQPGKYFLRRGGVQASLTFGVPFAIPPRFGHQIASFKGRLWLVGGTESGGTTQYKNDVWSSLDGKLWELESAAAEFSPPRNHRLIVFKDQLWLIDGKNQYAMPSQIWSSSNGIHWERRGEVPFERRIGYALLVHKDALWVIGGNAYSDALVDEVLNDVWSSTDGINWVQQATIPGVYREGHKALSFNGRLWILGGLVAADPQSDLELETGVWSSADGLSWQREIEHADLPDSFDTEFIVHDDQLWYCEGTSVGRSSDGVNWTEIAGDLNFPEPCNLTIHENQLWVLDHYGERVGTLNENGITRFTYHTIAPYAHSNSKVSFDGRIWMLGRLTDEASAVGSNDYYLWSSIDGLNWTLVNPNVTFATSPDHLIAFNNRLFIFMGGSSTSAGIWSSPDGYDWTHESAVPDFGERWHYPIVEFKQKLWLVAGDVSAAQPEDDYEYHNDIWSSDNGVDWHLVSEDGSFPDRSDHELVATEDHLLVIGGNYARNRWEAFHDQGALADVWASADGVDWHPLAADTGYSVTSSNIVYFNNAYWQIASRTINERRLHSSPDLINWTVVESDSNYNINYRGRSYGSLLVHEGKFFMFFRDGLGALDVWSSPDGAEWRNRVAGQLRFD